MSFLDLLPISDEEFSDIDARVTAHFGIKEPLTHEEFLPVMQKLCKNRQEIAAAIGVHATRLLAFNCRCLRRLGCA